MHSMRNCMLLPITDNIGDAMAFKVYEEIENYLKSSLWCNYKASGDLISIFSKYRDKLDEHLSDPGVLKTVADKIESGSLIKVKMSGETGKVILEIKIYGENGLDIYLNEKTILNKADLYMINQTIKNWLILYEAVIPYDGKVLGVLGDQITFQAGNREKFKLGQSIVIKKLVRKKEHPLLQKIVAWETTEVARGEIRNISHSQGLATVRSYTRDQKVLKGDWVVIQEEESARGRGIRPDQFKEDEQYSFGRLGELDLSVDLSNFSAGVSRSSENIKMGGTIYGISVRTEAWVTREYFALGEFSKRVGSLEATSGSPELSKADVSTSTLKIGAGYKYLPLGFFYGPQINFFGGWTSYTYDIEDSEGDYLGDATISGFFIGIGGSMPLQKGLNIFAKGEFVPFSDFESEGGVYPGAKSSNSMIFEVGAKYQYNPLMKFFVSMEVDNNTAKFKSGLKELNYKDTLVKVGISYTY